MVFIARHFTRNAEGAVQFIVGVKNEQKIGLIECVFQRLGAVVPEINPLVAMQLAFNARVGL